VELFYVALTKSLINPDGMYMSLATHSPAKSYGYEVSKEFADKLRRLMLRIPHKHEVYRKSRMSNTWRYWWAK